MRQTTTSLLWLIAASLPLASAPARAQEVTREDIVRQLSRFEAAPTIDLPALKQQTQERSKMRGRNEPPPSKRPPIAPELTSLPTFNVDIQFDVDTPIVRPESYQTVGRIADAMVYADLLPYTFLIVGHIEANGKRESNVILSQRRADAIRDILANTFKISVKRLQSVGLGEEQLLDPSKPTAPINQQIQIITVAKAVEEAAAPPPAAAPAAPSKQAPRKHRN
ncbi:Putative outer membrane protein [Bradyrhizobium sp. ORS 278]|uniref:OmpA family protein n=1 Tax=Bradyrhizobium sp. (strain ORS 278) TaxID=114615 RepID=UPI0001508CD2|nr:OmpA family protein [Bradyrhizobium sp. ORS 278]CAL79292.1 Putative outer membrane protein [Bradyrhizobium sp. ORS 278]